MVSPLLQHETLLFFPACARSGPACRVLIRTIRATGSTRDIVVLVAENVRTHSREQLMLDGAIVQDMPYLTRTLAENAFLARGGQR